MNIISKVLNQVFTKNTKNSKKINLFMHDGMDSSVKNKYKKIRKDNRYKNPKFYEGCNIVVDMDCVFNRLDHEMTKLMRQQGTYLEGVFEYYKMQLSSTFYSQEIKDARDKVWKDHPELYNTPRDKESSKMILNTFKDYSKLLLTLSPLDSEAYKYKAETLKQFIGEIPVAVITGSKSLVPSRLIIDDSLLNCFEHNYMHHSVFVKWVHDYTTQEDLDAAKECMTYKPIEGRRSAVIVIETPKGIVGFKRANGEISIVGGKINTGEKSIHTIIREVKEETSIDISTETIVPYGTMIAPDGFTVDTYYTKLNYVPDLMIQDDFQNEGVPLLLNFNHKFEGEFSYFNNLLFHNMEIPRR